MLKGVPLNEILLVELEILRDSSVYIDVCLYLGVLIELYWLLFLSKTVLYLIIVENTMRWFVLRIVVENVAGWFLSIVS